MGQIKNIKLHIVTDIKSFPESKMGENAEKKTEEFVIDPEKVLKYTRGKRVKAKHVKDRHLRNKLKNHEQKYEQSVKQAARAEILLTEQSGVLEAEGVERTHHFTQKDIAQSLDITSAQNFFNLKLDQFGLYKISYTRNGKYLLLGGAKGHLAGIDWPTKNLRCEVHARETVRDVTWLHNETMFAAAQKKCVYIYDNQGTEIHCLSDLADVNRLEFLPYHFLLASVSGTGHLRYQDTSTGKMISRIRTRHYVVPRDEGAAGEAAMSSRSCVVNVCGKERHVHGYLRVGWYPESVGHSCVQACVHVPHAGASCTLHRHLTEGDVSGGIRFASVRVQGRVDAEAEYAVYEARHSRM